MLLFHDIIPLFYSKVNSSKVPYEENVTLEEKGKSVDWLLNDILHYLHVVTSKGHLTLACAGWGIDATPHEFFWSIQ